MVKGGALGGMSLILNISSHQMTDGDDRYCLLFAGDIAKPSWDLYLLIATQGGELQPCLLARDVREAFYFEHKGHDHIRVILLMRR